MSVSASNEIIRLEQVKKIYNEGTAAEVQALRGVDMSINAGEFVAIMGASGSGKSTLMNLIGCLDTPTYGKVYCNQQDVSTLNPVQLARLRLQSIGFVFQNFQLLPRMTALANVMMPMAYADTPRAERTERAMEILASVGLADRANHLPSEMSGGQQQRVAIARSLINSPNILLADEPTGALDSKTGVEVLNLFERLHDQGRTIVLITHDAHVAEHARHTYIIADGLIAQDSMLGSHR